MPSGWFRRPVTFSNEMPCTPDQSARPEAALSCLLTGVEKGGEATADEGEERGDGLFEGCRRFAFRRGAEIENGQPEFRVRRGVVDIGAAQGDGPLAPRCLAFQGRRRCLGEIAQRGRVHLVDDGIDTFEEVVERPRANSRCAWQWRAPRHG